MIDVTTLMPSLPGTLPTLPPVVLPTLPGLDTTTTVEPNTTANEKISVVTCSDLTINSASVKSNEVGGLAVAMAINFCALVGAVLAMWLISRSERGRRVLVPKKHGAGGIGMPHGWFRDVCRIQYDDMDEISIDGQVVIRLCLLGLKFSAFGTLIACVLCPIYASTHGPEKGVLAWTMTNLSPDDDEYVFWFVVVAAYLLVFNFFWLIRAEWRHFVSLRQSHFLRRAVGKNGTSSAQAQFSLLVERLPDKYQDNKNLLALFSEIFPRQVHSVAAQRDTLLFYHLRALKKTSEAIVVCKCCQGCIHRYLEKTVQFERKVAQKYRQAGKYVQDFAMDGQVLELRDDLVTQLGVKELLGKHSNATDGGSASSAWTRPELRRSHRLDAESECAPTSTAFVTLRKLSDRVIAEQIPLFDAGRDLGADGVEKIVVKPAPEADDVIWENVQLPFDQMQQRRFVGRAVCVMGIIFWSFPITAIQALSQKNVLDQMLPHGWVAWLSENYPTVFSFITIYLPVVALLSLLVLLPWALHQIAVFVEARKSYAEVTISVMHRNFWFQFFSLWLSVFTSSLARSIGQILEHPRCMATILGSAIPPVCVYFISFVITRIGVSLPLLLLRPDGLLSLFIPGSNKPKDKADKAEEENDSVESDSDSASDQEMPDPGPENPVYCFFASEVTNINIVFVLALMYCVVAPVMMPACLLYFSLAFLVYKWLFVHVYTKQYDLLGESWYVCFWGLIVGVFFGTVSLSGLAASHKGSKSPHCLALWILSFLVLIFAWHCQRTFMPFCAALPYRAAVLADETSSAAVTEQFSSDYYHDPILSDMTENETRTILEHVESDEDDSDAGPCSP